MKKIYLNFTRWIIASITVFISTCFLNAQTVVTFPYTGAVQYFTVPSCVGTITVNVKGAQGTAGTSAAGLGGVAQGIMSVNQGQVLHIYVGGQAGFNGGAAGVAPGGTGGGASDIRVAPGNLSDRVIVAGGGGGGGATNANAPGGGGGAGLMLIPPGNFVGGGPGLGANGQGPPVGGAVGALNGGAGGVGNGSNNGGAGGGGGMNSGGQGGTNPNYLSGLPGTLGMGGAGGGPTGPGGGGGGYYGGGGASGGVNSNAGGGGGSSWTGTLTSPSFTPATITGNGVVTLTYNTNGSGVVASVSPTVICAGNAATLTGSGMVSYTWSPGGSNTSSITVNPASNSIYTVQGINAFGCLSMAEVTVMVNQAVPTLTVVNSASVVCAGKPSTLTASGAFSYTWAGGVNPANGVSFVPAATTNYTVSGSNACGTTTAVTSITVDPLPNIGGAINNPTVCYGTQVILNGTGSAGGYIWSAGVTNNTAFTPPVGINNYTVTGSGANSCTNTAVVTVTVLLTPTITPVATPSAICVGKTATLSATGAANGYTWSTSPAVFTSTAAVSPVVTSTYSVMRATGACTSIATVTVVVNPLPNLLVQAPNPPTICAGTCATVTGQGAITYTWFPGGFQGGVITVCPNSSTDYTVVASNANCTTSATSSVTVLPNPVLSIQASTTTPCAGSQITMTVTGASTYTWTSPIPVPQQNLNTVTDNPFGPTQYNVSGTDANGCTSITNLVILPQAAPNLTTSIVNTGSFICAGQTGTLVAQGTGQINYNWLPNGSSASTTTVNPPVSTVYTVTGTNPGTGCMSTATLSLAVYISTFVVSSPTAICKGNTATLSVAGAANSYTWNAGIPNNNDTIIVSPQNTTTYVVTGITGNCSTMQSINLIVNPIPPVTGVAQKITICRFEPGVLMGSGAGANGTYSWTGGAGASTQNFTVFPTITTTYTLTGTDVNGCSKTIPVTQLVATCIGIEEQSNLAGMLNIYPNPSRGEFTIQADVSMHVNIINELGQTVKTFTLNNKENKISVGNLANGIYFIRVEKDGNSGTRKIIVEK
jgi:hypothetical protein